MSGYRAHSAPQPLLFGYDPVRDLPPNHLARLVEQVVEDTVQPPPRWGREGQPPFDPRLCLKVLLFAYATGVRSSRRIEQLCRESLPYLFLTRGDTPSYRTLCTARKTLQVELEAVWEGLLAVAAAAKLTRVGQIVLDSSRWGANAGREATVGRDELAVVLAEFRRILAEAERTDAEEAATPRNTAELAQALPTEQVREILRRVRREQSARKAAAGTTAEGATAEGATTEGATTEGTTTDPAVTTQGTLALDLPTATGAQPPTEPTEAAMPEGNGPVPPSSGTSDTAATSATTATARRPEGPASPTGRTRPAAWRRRVETVIQVLEAALAQGRKHVNLTDPEAEFMPLGAEKKLGLGHSFEGAVDQGVLVVGQRGVGATDNTRLQPLLDAAAARTPGGIRKVDADSGFYQGETIGKLLRNGVDVAVPDSNTAGDLHRGLPIGTTRRRTGEWTHLEWDAEAGLFRCRNDNELRVKQVREEHGQQWTVYRAVQPCTECPDAAQCLQRRDAKHRTVRVGEYHAELEAARQRFGTPEYQERYRQRGAAIETVFAFIEHILGYRRWWLRGQAGTAAEAQWIGLAYLTRKIAVRWAGPSAVPTGGHP